MESFSVHRWIEGCPSEIERSQPVKNLISGEFSRSNIQREKAVDRRLSYLERGEVGLSRRHS